MVTWAPGTASSPVDIAITTDGVAFTALATGTANDGSEAVTTPATPSTAARIRVTETSTGLSDISDAVFTISGIRVTAPNGGESWKPGEAQTVTWTSTGISGTVDILYSIDGSSWLPLVTGTADDGTESVVVPAAPSATALVRVAQSVGSLHDESDAVFTIAGFMTDAAAGLWGIFQGCARWGDYDGDGDLDIALAGFGTTGATTRIFRNDGSGPFVDIAAPILPSMEGSLAWGDYDLDGDLDIALSGSPLSTALLFRNDGADVFTNTSTPLTFARYCGVAWADFDNDGDLDLSIAGYDPSTSGAFRLWRNDGGGIFTPVATAVSPVNNACLDWGDFDGDGDLDLVVAGGVSGVGYVTRIYRNDGAGVFTDIGATLPGVKDGCVKWGDFDNDGDLDLAICGDPGVGTYVRAILRNDGGTFVDIGAPIPSLSTFASVAWGDCDNDGDLDLAIAGAGAGGTSTLTIMRNDGSGVFTPINSGMAGRYYASLDWGDADGDGDMDLLATGSDGTTILSNVYRNGILRLNTAPTAPTGLSALPTSLKVSLSWSPATDDHTPFPGLSYNLRVGSTPGAANVYSSMADITTGRRRIPAPGPVQGTSAWLKLPAGIYYWSVQAIDTSRLGGAWATEGTFTVP